MTLISSDINPTSAPYFLTGVAETFLATAINAHATTMATKDIHPAVTTSEKIAYSLIKRAKLSFMAGTNRAFAAPLNVLGGGLISLTTSTLSPIAGVTFIATSEALSYAASKCFHIIRNGQPQESTIMKTAQIATSTLFGIAASAAIVSASGTEVTLYDAASYTAYASICGSAILNIAAAIKKN